MAKLVVVSRPGAEPQVMRLGPRPLTFGREPENDVPLDGLEVSRRHCRLEPLPQGGYRIVDLQSKNGTFLNGRPVTAMALDYHDQIRVGDSLLLYVEDGADPHEALGKVQDHTSWLSFSGGSAEPDLLDDAVEEEGATWRSARPKREVPGPHTRVSNRSYLKERLLRLGLLTQNIASAPDLSRLMDTILDEVLDFTGFERGLLLLGDEEGGNHLQPILGRYMDHENLEDAERRFSRGLVEEALRDKRITFRSRMTTGDSSFSARDSVVSMGLESALCIPLIVPERDGVRRERRRRARRSRVLGALYLDSTSPIRPLDRADLELLEAVAAQAAIALQNARLHHQATTDPLTELYNRNFIRRVFDDELRQGREDGASVGVLILDLDHFKRVNDTYGHGVGDEVLKRVAQRIRRSIRRDDYAARWGGEEFLILLPDSNIDGTRVVAEKVSAAIKGQPIGEASLKVTTSIGLACFPDHGDNPATLLKRADQALYAAKAAGRDQVVVFTADLDRSGQRTAPFEGLLDGNPANTQRNIKAIFDTIDLLRSERTSLEILERTLDNVCDLTRARRALLIVERDDGKLAVTCARGQGGRSLEGGALDFSRSTAQLAIAEQRALCLLDADQNSVLTTSSIDRLGLNTVMCVPLRVGQRTIGVLYADDTVANREFGEQDLAHLEVISHQLGLTLASNPELYEAASGQAPATDDTARLRAEVERLKSELEEVKRTRRLEKRDSSAD